MKATCSNFVKVRKNDVNLDRLNDNALYMTRFHFVFRESMGSCQIHLVTSTKSHQTFMVCRDL